MKPLHVVAVLVTILTLSLGHTTQTKYFVTPNEDTPCPALPCHTLFHYLENTTLYFTSNTTINFLQGVHEINKSGMLLIENVNNLTLTGYSVSSSHAAKITCMKPAVLTFFNIINLVLKHLSILECGYPATRNVYTEKQWISVAVALQNITSLRLLDISVENSTGYGVFGIDILGNSFISHSRFMFNNYYTLSSTNCSYGLGSCEGGNMKLQYQKTSESIVMETDSIHMVSIDSCVFSDGVDISEGHTVPRASGGLTFINYYYKIIFSMYNVVSTKNIGKAGANFLFQLAQKSGINIIVNTTSSLANYLQSPVKTPLGFYSYNMAGFEFIYGVQDLVTQKPTPNLTTNQTVLQIFDSTFDDNFGGGMNIEMRKGYCGVKIIIKNCSFQRNISPTGSGIRIGKPGELPCTLRLEVLIQDTKFINNTKPERLASTSLNIAYNVVDFDKLKDLQIINCTFVMNKQTALQAFDSTLYFGGHVIFSGNTGVHGGAVALTGDSKFYMMPYTHVQITNNHAMRGGGIYVRDENTLTTTPCFFQLLNLKYSYSNIDAVVTLENNTADEAGSAVYGGEIDQCYVYTSSLQLVYNSTIFTELFKIVDNFSLVSQVSSNPVTVCFCKCKYTLLIENNILVAIVHMVEVYPGQLFKVPVVLYGQRNGSVPGIVRADLVNKSRGAHFAPLQETQETKSSCTNLTYNIFSDRQQELILLGVDGVQYHGLQIKEVLINVTLLPCPPGFQLSTLTAQCECNPQLKERGLLCNISNATPLVRRTKSVWISSLPNTILHDNCPLDYCKPISLWLQLNHSDEQCAYEHSGLLCGRCKSNLSLALGTSQCLVCTHVYLTLLLPFALAGLILVMFLIVCNLTVSMGTINGLIFYANIVRVNQAFFFVTPKTSALKIFQQVLAIFIAWLNLDLGIETCFFHGMDAYIRAWLQFAFPFYIWMIVGVIIYLSRRSTTIVKLVGSSAVSVLATLFLLSYAKLQRTVITAFSFTYLQNYYGDGRSLAVWLYDGNVPFLQGKHIGLFLMALAVTVFFLLPFTLLLLFAPCIQASRRLPLKWIKMKLLPLLDAYQAPYKDRFRFWTGLMLVVRSILLVGFGLNILGDPNLNHLLTVTVLSILFSCTWITGIVYKNRALNILETSFVLNLLVLSGWTVYNRHASNGDSNDGQTALVCTSIGVAFITFICIIFYHTYLYLKSTKLHQCFNRHTIKREVRREMRAVEGSGESAVDAPPHRPPTVTVIELREPLLTEN